MGNEYMKKIMIRFQDIENRFFIDLEVIDNCECAISKESCAEMALRAMSAVIDVYYIDLDLIDRKEMHNLVNLIYRWKDIACAFINSRRGESWAD